MKDWLGKSMLISGRGWRGLVVLMVLLPVCLANTEATAEGLSAVERGEYVFKASGGCGCHTNTAGQGAFMAGGRPIKTPFGTVYGTNITPDTRTGIGA
jgi:thiosulfate dehydrogenase